MTKEMDDNSTKTEWSIWSYKHYRRMLDEEMAEACRIYAEVELADLPVSKGKEAQKWLTGAHGNVKRAHERISMHIRRLGGAGELGAPLQTPKRVYTLKQQERRRTQLLAHRKAKQEQAKEAAARARLQAARATGAPEGSQLAGGVDTGSKETGGGHQRDSACPRTPGGAKVDLVDSTSESDTSDPGGMPQLFRGAAGLSACPLRPPCMLPHQTGHEKARREVATQEAGELPAVDVREESRAAAGSKDRL
jgi:hypothetical protein